MIHSSAEVSIEHRSGTAGRLSRDSFLIKGTVSDPRTGLEHLTLLVCPLPALGHSFVKREDKEAPLHMERRIPRLDAVRGVAILVVMAHNISLKYSMFTIRGTSIQKRLNGGQSFFVLSRFLITGILIDTKSSTGYFKILRFAIVSEYGRFTIR